MHPTKRLLLVTATIAALALLAPSAAAASGGSSHSRALHITKECSEYTRLAGGFCTITSSNLAAIPVGSKVVYEQALGVDHGARDGHHPRSSGPGRRGVRPRSPRSRGRARRGHLHGRDREAHRVHRLGGRHAPGGRRSAGTGTGRTASATTTSTSTRPVARRPTPSLTPSATSAPSSTPASSCSRPAPRSTTSARPGTW